jgi:hypothetical protein
MGREACLTRESKSGLTIVEDEKVMKPKLGKSEYSWQIRVHCSLRAFGPRSRVTDPLWWRGGAELVLFLKFGLFRRSKT